MSIYLIYLSIFCCSVRLSSLMSARYFLLLVKSPSFYPESLFVCVRHRRNAAAGLRGWQKWALASGGFLKKTEVDRLVVCVVEKPHCKTQ